MRRGRSFRACGDYGEAEPVRHASAAYLVLSDSLSGLSLSWLLRLERCYGLSASRVVDQDGLGLSHQNK